MKHQSFTLEEPGYLNTAVMTDDEREGFDKMLKTFDKDGHKGRVNILSGLAAKRFVSQAFEQYGADGAATVHDSLVTNMHPDISEVFTETYLGALEIFINGLEGEIL